MLNISKRACEWCGVKAELHDFAWSVSFENQSNNDCLTVHNVVKLDV